MKLTKRILSLCLALAMLLTVAAFPAFAEESTYTPKTVYFVHPEGQTLTMTNGYKTSSAFQLPDGDYYVGDTVTFTDTFFTDNAITFDGAAVEDIVINVVKYGDSSANKALYSAGDYGLGSYTFPSAGIYAFKMSGYVSGGTTTWRGNHYFGVVEVKDPATIKEVHKPTTEKTSGGTLTLTKADVEIMKSNGKDENHTDPNPEKLSILGSNSQDFTGSKNQLPSLILDMMFEFDSVGYVENITWQTNADNMFYMADVYGSLDGEDWYLLTDDCVLTPNGTATSSDKTTFTATVNGVARYVKLRNFKWKGANMYAHGTTGAAATGFALNEGDWTTGGEGGETPEPTTVDVTFVDVTGTNEDVVKTIDAGATVAAPDAYATGYKFYSDEACETEVDLLTATFNVATTIYVKAQTTTPDPEEPDTPVIDTPKTVTVIRNPYFASGSVEVKPSYVKSYVPFVLSHKDIYIGDTIKIADDLFTANTFTFEGTKIVYAKMWVQKYPSNDAGRQGLDSQTGTTFTFTEPGIYILRNEHYRLDNGNGGTTYKYYGDGRYDVFEVKDPDAVEAVAKPTTNKTSGATAASVSQAVIDSMLTTYTSETIKVLDFTSAAVHITEAGFDATQTFAGLVLDYKFTLNSVSYVESVSWKASTDNGIYMVDVYGSIDGEDWYLLNEDCVVSPNGLNTTTTETTFTAEVDGVAKYVKLANPRWKGQCLSKYTKDPSVVGFELADGEWSTGEEEPTYSINFGETVLVPEITDDVLAGLRLAYHFGEGQDYIVKGWKMGDTEVEYNWLINAKASQITGDIVPTVVPVSFDVSVLYADVVKADSDTSNFVNNPKYENGLHVQGAQFRVADAEKDVTAGLRFINVVSKAAEDAIIAAGATNVKHGTLAKATPEDYSVIDLEYGEVYHNEGEKIYNTAAECDGKYYKYTLCVTGFNIAENQHKTKVYVRPYISFELDDTTHYIYGEQYWASYEDVVNQAVTDGDISQDYANTILGLQ